MKYQRLSDLEPLVGQEMGVSEWIDVAQSRIDAFARATDDLQWIHVDAERAAAGPFGTTIAHGYLTLSLRAPKSDSALARLRGRFKLLEYKPIDGGAQLTCEVTVERDGSDRPVCVAESISRRYR
jgi:acyl dehydratase